MTNDTENAGNRDKSEKRNWFHSLSRRRKSSTSTTSNSTSQKLQNSEPSASPSTAAAAPIPTSNQDSATEDANPISGKERKRKDERKNVFQRFKKRMGIRFSMRQKKSTSTETTSSNSNGQHAEGIICYPRDLSLMIDLDPPEMIPFTQHYRKFVTKKWLDNASRPNRVMYTACSEMLSQVWYWGEISRRDAQRQLKDKPIGSFLVRDSETGGSSTCWYTLSFRILNCTLHYRLEHRANYWHFEELQYESIVEMIEDILHRCTKDHFVCYVRVPNEFQPPLAVVLKYPVSRYIKIMKLQDLCRRVIQRHVAADEIQELQIPVKLQEYLRETPELIPRNPKAMMRQKKSTSTEMVPFTQQYRKFVTKKWLDSASPSNRIMYTACSEMLSQVWYWGEISRRDAQRQLKDKPIGSFLVRDSETGGSSTCWYTLSFRMLNCTLHYRLEHRANYWHFGELQYESIVEMIEDILHRCTKDHYVCYVRFPNQFQLPVVLKYPLSRYINIMKLQDLSCHVIQRHVAADEIQELEIPVKLQEYLRETPELVFQSL